MDDSLSNHSATRAVDFAELNVSSPAFSNEGFIPARYTCDGQNVNPPLLIEHIPEEAQSLVIIVEDPDAPGKIWTHWIVWDIPVTHYIKENEIHGVVGMNDFKTFLYGGPCPPSGTHRYIFKVYALDTVLKHSKDTGKDELEKDMSDNIIAFGELVGLYKKSHSPGRSDY